MSGFIIAVLSELGLARESCSAASRSASGTYLASGMCFVASVLFAAAVTSAQTGTDESSSRGLKLFESSVRPMLVEHCLKCHSTAAGKQESGLLLDSRDGVRRGGDRGAAVVPGKPDESVLLKALAHSDDDLKMPPKHQRLPGALIADVQRWIRLGAPDPRDASASPKLGSIDLESARKFWAYLKPIRQSPPIAADSNWAISEIDRFILAKLKSSGLAPSTDAEPETLLRRVYFDLIGLPPSPETVQGFRLSVRSEGLDGALGIEVDRLLESKHFGERWGRHWLDVARFAESSGKEANISFPYAWRYRDYVIDCLNTDVPFDRFITEQLAGDLLPYADDKQRARQLIATGFLALGPKNLDEANGLQFQADVIDEQIDAVSRAVMANSVACARCHDHKFEPYSMEDYTALVGIFASTKTYFGTYVSPANRIGGDPLHLPRAAEQPILHKGIPEKQVQELKDQLASLQKDHRDGMAAVYKAVAAGKDPGDIFTLRDALRIFWRSGGIEGQLEKVDEHGNPLPLAMGVLDADKKMDAPLLERGDISHPGNPVARGFPRVFQLDQTITVSANQSGRLELARWLTRPEHPLTSRVFVNRIWKHLFGAGIVRTVDNFGSTGESPSHSELLDYLAVQFVEDGWQVKKLVRRIVLSRTYRQASDYIPRAFQVDPENRLLWRASKRRLDAEVIRDAMLVATRELDTQRPVGSLVAHTIGDRPISLIGLDPKIPSDLDGVAHRSVYLPVLRDRLPDVLDLFDFAEASLVTGARETTNVPVQALYLMNSPFVQARAVSLAKRLMQASSDNRERVQMAFMLCYSRQPDEEELALALAFLAADTAQSRHTSSDKADRNEKVLMSFCQSLLSTAEFRNID